MSLLRGLFLVGLLTTGCAREQDRESPRAPENAGEATERKQATELKQATAPSIAPTARGKDSAQADAPPKNVAPARAEAEFAGVREGLVGEGQLRGAAWVGDALALVWQSDVAGRRTLHFGRWNATPIRPELSYVIPEADAWASRTARVAAMPGGLLAVYDTYRGRRDKKDRTPPRQVRVQAISTTSAGTPVPLGNRTTGGQFPDLVATGTGYVAAWFERDGLFWQRLDAAGRARGEPQRLQRAEGGSLSLAGTGSGVAAVWTETKANAQGFWFTPNVTNAAGAPRRLLDGARVSTVRLVWNGSGYGVVYTLMRAGEQSWGRGENFFARLSQTGDIEGTPLKLGSPESIGYGPSVVWTGEEYGVAWTWSPEGSASVGRFARVSAAGSLIGKPLSLDGAVNSVVSWTGQKYALLWNRLERKDERGRYSASMHVSLVSPR